jgi:hypothetical protein
VNKRFKTLFALLTLALCSVAGSAHAAETKKTQDPLSSSVSLHSMIISKDNNEVKDQIPRACIGAIQKTIRSGKTFYSKIMVKDSIAVGQFPREDVQDGNFYHWTNSSELEGIARRRQFSSVYKYLRSRCNSKFESCLGGWYMYVAGDDYSSSEFGSILYKITLSKTARIFIFRGDFHPDNYKTDQLNADIEAELIAKEPDLQNCQQVLYHKKFGTPSILEALALEASGISASAYYGVDNRYGDQREGSQWLQLVGPWVIQKMERVQ